MLTLYVAAAGYGKTEAARAGLRGVAARWFAGDEAAEFLREPGRSPRVVVLDRPSTTEQELVAWLARTSAERVVVLSRRVLSVRCDTVVGPADLAMSPTAVARLHGDPHVATEVHARTAGWPALVRLAARPDALAEYVTREVLGSLPPDARRLVETFAPLGPVSAELCRDLGVPAAAIGDLVRLGVLLPRGAGGHRLVPAVAAVADAAESGVDVAWVASWYARHGEPGAAARLHREHGNTRCLAAILTERGEEVLAGEGAGATLELVDAVGVHTPPLRRLRERAAALLPCSAPTAEHLLADARYAEALVAAEAEVARARDADTLSRALTCCGRALARLGRHDDALNRLGFAMTIERSPESLCHLGDVHRDYGRDNSARAAYQEALVRAGGDLVPALAGLAVVDRSPDLAERACALASGRELTVALLAKARLGDVAAARRAVDNAGLHDDRAGLAEALELAAGADPAVLTEALEIWRATGARLDVWRVTARLGALPGATVVQRVRARQALDRLAAAGVYVPDQPAAVAIRTLGRFDVLVHGASVPASAWQSRKARDLLRILATRLGRGIGRERLAALLWDDDSAKVGHRLSVTLSTVRTVLDPEKAFPADHYILGGQSSVALNLAHVSIDLEEFLAEAAHGLRHRDPAVLEHAEALYTGDLYEDDPYDTWADATREEARATYLRVLRTLAELHNGETDTVARYLRRLLANDPCDEQAHLDLIDALTTAGHHGEARRARNRYTTAMRQIA